MNENLLRHTLWAWAILHFGWEPGENAAGEMVALDLWQRQGLDVWEAPIGVLLAAALQAAGNEVTFGFYDGALRVQKTPSPSGEGNTALILSVRRGRKWHGLGLADSYETAAFRITGQARPELTVVKGGPGK